MKLYRFIIHEKSTDDWEPIVVDVKLNTYDSFKDTPCGYWIKVKGRNKWVSKTGKKRFAYDDKKLALTNFIKRTTKWKHIVDRQARICDLALNVARVNEQELIK